MMDIKIFTNGGVQGAGQGRVDFFFDILLYYVLFTHS